MNLWAKILKQLTVVSVALFFLGCEDESSFLGLKNPSRKFEVFTVEIPLTSSVIAIDSVYTDNKTVNGGVVVGSYNDGTVGPVNATAFLQIIPTRIDTIAPTSVFDSITVQLRSNFYSYGFNGERAESFSIHEVNAGQFPLTSADRYEASTSFSYSENSIGALSFAVNSQEFQEQFVLAAAQQDTLLASSRLPDEWGMRIFSLAQQYDFSSEDERTAFIEQVPGLALVPDNSEALNGLRFDAFSKVTLYYRTFKDGVVEDTLSRDYNFTGASFSSVTVDRSGTELSSIGLPYTNIPLSSDLRYVQSGTPLVTKVDLANFYEFLKVDSVQDMLINEVRFTIGNVMSSAELPSHSVLGLKLINRNGYFYNYGVSTERQALASEFAIPATTSQDAHFRHYFVASETSQSPSGLGYNKEEMKYEANITTFAQVLLDKERNSTEERPAKVNYIGIVPFSPSVNFSTTRTIFNANGIKLKIYYTKPVVN